MMFSTRKCVLYIGLIYTLAGTVITIEDSITQFNLLEDLPENSFTYANDSIDGTQAYNLANKPLISRPADKLSISNQNMAVPFLISTIFKYDELTYVCLFTIADELSDSLKLCLYPVSTNILKWSLTSLPETGKIFRLKKSFNTWTKVQIYVEKDKIRVFHNCTEKLGFNSKGNFGEGVTISPTSTVRIGYNVRNLKGFDGAIQELKIYPNVNVSIIDEICPNLKIGKALSDSDEEPGRHGTFETCDTCSAKNETGNTESTTISNEDAETHDEEGVEVKTLVYTSTKALFKQTSKVPVGTLAFVSNEGILLLRVKSGWEEISKRPFTST